MGDCFRAWNVTAIQSAIIASFSFAIGVIVLSHFFEDDLYLRILLSDIAHSIVAILSAFCLILAAAYSRGKMRSAWGFLAAAMFSAALADMTWAFLETRLGMPPFPSFADLFYLLFYPLFALGILTMPLPAQSHGERFTRLLDTGVVMIAAALMTWCFLITPNMEASAADPMTLALSTIYPVADLLLLFAILQVIFQPIPVSMQRPMIVLAISTALFIVADSAFSIMSLKGTYVSGGTVDDAYIISYALIGLAGFIQAKSASLEPSYFPAIAKNSRYKSQLMIMLPLAGAAATYALLIWGVYHGLSMPLSSLAWGIGAIMGLILIRQTVLLKENRGLYSSAQKEIAERKQAVEAYHLLVDFSLQGLAIFRSGRILFVNQALADMIGYSVKELLAMSGEQMKSIVHPRDLDLIRNRYMYHLNGKSLSDNPDPPGHYEFRVFRKDGSVAWWEVYATPIEYQGERALQAAIMDITGRKAGEEAILKAKEAADLAARSKSDFLASMSHEIRTPLTAVLGMSELMLDTPLNDEQHEFMDTILSSSKSLLSIISDILDISKIEADKLVLSIKPMEITAVVEDALDVISSAACDKNLEVICDIDESVPKRIQGDSGRLKQILVNLMGNAVKFTEKGEVLIKVCAAGERGKSKLDADGLDKNEVEIKFAIVDTGIGIPKDQMGKLFSPFSQVNSNHLRSYGGTGLGLAISKSLVDLMGGRIWAESEPEKGSIFYFTIRAVELVYQDSQKFGYGLSGKRLLIVASNNSLRKALGKLAASWGMYAAVSSSGAQAMGFLEGIDALDAIILDQALPDMDAFELARIIHEMPKRAPIPVLLMKSMGNKETSADIGETLVKPIKPSQFYKALHHAILAENKDKSRDNENEDKIWVAAIDSSLAGRYPLRILVAEDNPVNLKVVTRALSRMGYGPDIAISGLEVLDALQVNRYDLILMDIQMPEMDGIECTRLIRALHPGGQNPRIVAMTALAMEGDKERCLEAGMDDYISKPVKMEELVSVLERSSVSTKAEPISIKSL